MRKIAITMIMLLMLFSMAACGDKPETGADIPADNGETLADIPEDNGETLADIPENGPSEAEEYVKMYELTNIEYVMDNGETQQGDFIPGSEIYIFTESDDSLNFEYRYKKYPTEEDMLNDSNYTIESVFGAYTLNMDKTQLALVADDGSFRQGEVSGDKIIFEYSQEGYNVKMVTTYTETDEVNF